MFATYFSIIASLFVVEVLLSIDNALVNATLAEALPEPLRKKALRIGIILGALLRVLALFVVAIIVENVWIRLLGALYLIYLAMAHLGKVVDEEGHTVKAKDSFKGVVIQIALADIVFSLDNVVSAVSFSSNTLVVILGVMIGVISMLFITPLLSRLIHRYKGLVYSAYVIVGCIGIGLLLETTTHLHIEEWQKFLAIFVIIAFTFLYEHSRTVKKMTTPALRGAQYILGLPFDLVYFLKRKIKSK
jgi:YkoY family integral membrane protein